MIAGHENSESASRFRLRFSLLALLAIVTLICVALAWWQFGYLKRQRLLVAQKALAQYISNTNEKIADKWETYLAIAKESGQFELGTDGALREVATNQLDRVNTEIFRLENHSLADEETTEEGREQIGSRIAALQAQRNALLETLQKHIEPSIELEMLKREIEQLQQKVDDLSRVLTEVEIEIQTGR
jgi:hypothetical protein